MKKTLWSILLLVGCCALPTLAEVNNCRHVSKDILYPEQAIEDEKAKDLEQQAKQRRQTAYDVCIAGVEKSFAGQLN